ncbi:MAG: hypothetical protein NTX05_00915 [Fusobacteria bacterium]|nr:hypothetical protein [Fusobacteriota bacterium]
MDLLKYSVTNYIFGIIMIAYPTALLFMSNYMIFAPIVYTIITGMVDVVILGLFIFFMFRFNKSIKKNYQVDMTFWITLMVVGYVATVVMILIIRSLYRYDLGMLTVAMILVCVSIYFGVVLVILGVKMVKFAKSKVGNSYRKLFALYGVILFFSGVTFASVVLSIAGPFILGLSFIQMGYIFSKS